MIQRLITIFFAGFYLSVCALAGAQDIPLDGDWHIKMNQAGEGLKAGWQKEVFDSTMVRLPGTVESHRQMPPAAKSAPEQASLAGFTQLYEYRGAVWFQREIELPESSRGKRLELFLERCQWETFVWVGEEFQGTRNSLLSPHRYNLSKVLMPGKHRVTIMVDNSNRKTGMEVSPDNTMKFVDLTTEVKEGAKLNCGGHHLWSHNWNGILGRIELRVQDPINLGSVDIYPQLASSSVRLRLKLRNDSGVKGRVQLQAKWEEREAQASVISSADWSVDLTGEAEQLVEHPLRAEGEIKAWDEFMPQLYWMTVNLSGQECADSRDVRFGMREIGSKGTQFTVNGRNAFMRATLENFIFPLTGHPPMDVASWRKMIGIAKEYGLNMFRFHSCTPPAAAFDAADELGFYFQVEVPGTSCPSADEGKEVEDFLTSELVGILDTYGNHPSLLFVSMGNEQLVSGSREFRLRHEEVLQKKVRLAQQRDPRHLYTCTTQPFVRKSSEPGDDFVVSASAPRDYSALAGIRWSGGLVIDCSRFNTHAPETVSDYSGKLKGCALPLMTHEVGQWAVYPDLREITRYHGAQRADNFENIRERLRKKGMLEWSADFTRASGMLALTLYKEEIESALRTRELAGFQLLDIHDYPGQGTSTVGILSALWESKGLITPRAFRAFCSPTVLLARLPKRVWTNDETFSAQLDMANYSHQDRAGAALWSLTGEDGTRYASGVLPSAKVQSGSYAELGQLSAALSNVSSAQKLTLRAEWPDGLANSWDVWVYPAACDSEVPAGVTLATQWNDTTRDLLRQGKRVLLVPSKETLRAPVAGTFTPVFWNVQMKNTQVSKTMGLLINSADPALADFPTDDHSNWQWWDPVMRSPVMPIDGFPQALRPCVAVIDNFLDNRRLALVFECKVGPGHLLVCSVDILNDLDKRPVARQLRCSLMKYISSPMFLPDVEVHGKALDRMLLETN